MTETITQIDFQILYWIQEHCTNGILDWLMPKITALGNSGTLWILLGVMLLLWKNHRKEGVLLLAGLGVGALVGNVILKNLVERQRPCWLDETVAMLIAVPKDYSFPSGHTMASFVAAVILFHLHKKVGIVALGLAVLIALSRLYLFVHFPTDVLAGAVLGIGIGLLSCWIFEWILHRKQTKMELTH